MKSWNSASSMSDLEGGRGIQAAANRVADQLVGELLDAEHVADRRKQQLRLAAERAGQQLEELAVGGVEGIGCGAQLRPAGVVGATGVRLDRIHRVPVDVDRRTGGMSGPVALLIEASEQ